MKSLRAFPSYLFVVLVAIGTDIVAVDGGARALVLQGNDLEAGQRRGARLRRYHPTEPGILETS